MRTPVRPTAEVQRLDALRQYNILDIPPDQALDDLAALAAQICDVPIALITVVDDRRQWFKSRVGMAITDLPREVSMCADTLAQQDVFVVADHHEG